MKKFFLMLGRICLSLVFICAVTNQILNWDATQQYFISCVTEWLSYPGLPDNVQKLFNYLMANASLAVLIAAIFAGLGGLLVLLGIKVRFGVVLLILFLIPTTIIMHAFWLYDGANRELQMIMFLKNISILGGCFILASSTGGEG
jgi:putative oxidoreductase